MEKIYLLESDDKELQIHCRVKKNKIVCKSICNTFWITFSKSVDNEIFLDECVFQTGWSYTNALSSVFSSWVRKWIDPCFIMAFYCFIDAKRIEIPYSWSLEYSQNGHSVAWGLGKDHISSGELGLFQGHIQEIIMDIDKINCERPDKWEDLKVSEENIILQYV